MNWLLIKKKDQLSLSMFIVEKITKSKFQGTSLSGCELYNIAKVLISEKRMEQMLVFATDEAKKYSLKIIKEVWVPGSMEKPLAVKKTTFK